MDCIIGDQSLFASHEEVMRCWEILQPVIEYCQANPTQPMIYQPGTDGPASADTLAANFDSAWL